MFSSHCSINDDDPGLLPPNVSERKMRPLLETPAETNPTYKFFEVVAFGGGSTAQAKVGIDHVRVSAV